jgi:hypothetical protein
MKVLRYPVRALVGDYCRAAVVVAIGCAVLLSVPRAPVIIGIFGGLTLLFLIFGLRTAQRHIMQVAITNEAIGTRDVTAKSLPWNRLERLKLRFYGTRKQLSGGGGFMQLTLKGSGTSMTFESSIDSFTLLAWRAAKAARDNRISVDPTSAGNLLDLGIDLDSDLPPPGDHSPADL